MSNVPTQYNIHRFVDLNYHIVDEEDGYIQIDVEGGGVIRTTYGIYYNAIFLTVEPEEFILEPKVDNRANEIYQNNENQLLTQ